MKKKSESFDNGGAEPVRPEEDRQNLGMAVVGISLLACLSVAPAFVEGNSTTCFCCGAVGPQASVLTARLLVPLGILEPRGYAGVLQLNMTPALSY